MKESVVVVVVVVVRVARGRLGHTVIASPSCVTVKSTHRLLHLLLFRFRGSPFCFGISFDVCLLVQIEIIVLSYFLKYFSTSTLSSTSVLRTLF